MLSEHKTNLIYFFTCTKTNESLHQKHKKTKVLIKTLIVKLHQLNKQAIVKK